MRIFVQTVLLAGLALAPGMAQDTPDQAAQIERFLDRWQQMTPEEREKALSRLPPARRERLERRLRRLEMLSEQDRADLRTRLQEFRSLPAHRQDALRLEIQALRAMRPAMRWRRMNSAAFARAYSAEEQKLLRQALGME